MGNKAWVAWCALVTAGIITMALPDGDARVFTISRTHGPSAVDAVGTALILVAWAMLVAGIWRRRARLPRSAGWAATTGAALIGGLILTAWSVLGDHGQWWVLGIALATGPQLVAAIAVSGTGGLRADP